MTQGFLVRLSGDLDVGDEYWQQLAERCQWIIEIEARDRGNGTSNMQWGRLRPRRHTRTPLAHSPALDPSPTPIRTSGPFFAARIFVRATRSVSPDRCVQLRTRSAAGVRVYMEGFRVLPYGETR